jgi:type I restriction enzyme S subunit
MIVKSIPKSWQIKSLEEILLFVIGGDWGKDETYLDETYDLAYCIRGSEIKNWEIDRGKTASLRKIKKNNIEKRKLQNGDILVEISGGGPEQPVGRTVLIDNISLNHNKGILYVFKLK